MIPHLTEMYDRIVGSDNLYLLIKNKMENIT